MGGILAAPGCSLSGYAHNCASNLWVTFCRLRASGVAHNCASNLWVTFSTLHTLCSRTLLKHSAHTLLTHALLTRIIHTQCSHKVLTYNANTLCHTHSCIVIYGWDTTSDNCYYRWFITCAKVEHLMRKDRTKPRPTERQMRKDGV